jgi:hypothetical protein
MPPTGYRYVSASEVTVVKASIPWRVPNFDLAGKPKIVYFTWDYFTSATVAEKALQIGVFHPFGPFASPTERLDLDLAGITYTNHGTVPGGTGSEVTTTDSPLVTAINPLGP